MFHLFWIVAINYQAHYYTYAYAYAIRAPPVRIIVPWPHTHIRRRATQSYQPPGHTPHAQRDFVHIVHTDTNTTAKHREEAARGKEAWHPVRAIYKVWCGREGGRGIEAGGTKDKEAGILHPCHPSRGTW
eukprot:scaffold2583_cov140-Isochrysis_galbana.AAC.2